MSIAAPITPLPAPATPRREDGEKELNGSLNFGSSTPGTLATTPSLTTPTQSFSPLSPLIVGRFGDSFSDGDDSVLSETERLGISRPVYHTSDDAGYSSAESCRIGITRSSYELPDGDIPLSSMNLIADKSVSSPTPNLIDSGDEDSEGHSQRNIDWRSIQAPALEHPLSVPQIASDDSELSDDVDRMIHKDTAKGHYLVNSVVADAPIEGMKYCLTKGKKGMSMAMRIASDRGLVHRKGANGYLRMDGTAIPDKPVHESVPEPTPLDAPFKVFLLLIQPKSKIFELIQVIYSPSETTIGLLLKKIPENATEPALGSQKYTGLCRPKDGIEIKDLDLMASGSRDDVGCARITRGEILVAIPEGFDGRTCAEIGKPIFANPKIKKLLKRSDPLSVKKRGRSSKAKSWNVEVVETVKEEFEAIPAGKPVAPKAAPGGGGSVGSAGMGTTSEMEMALRHAAALASSAVDAVATVDEPAAKETDEKFDNNCSDSKPDLQRSLECDESLDTSTVFSSDTASSVNNSFSFQQKAKKRTPRRFNRRKRQVRSKRKLYLLRLAAAAFAFMVGRYMFESDDSEEGTDDSLGILGLFQVLIFFLALVKTQETLSKRNRRRRAPTKALSFYDQDHHRSTEHSAT